MICQKFKIKRIMWVVVICIGFFIILNFAIKYRIQIAPLAPENTVVTEKQLTKDVNTILSLYGLNNSRSDLVVEISHPNYKNHIVVQEDTEKGIVVQATPILFDLGRKFTEVETYMEIWLYVMNHDFRFEIDGIIYYFTSPSLDSILAPLIPNELYMTREDFLSFYNSIDVEDLTHPEKVKELTKSYVKKTGYQRKSGHVTVRDN